MRSKLISFSGMRWLFAETLVIVLGVLIALGLNDYWTEREERSLAIDYIKRLQGAVAWDLSYVRDRLQPTMVIKREALEFIQPIVSGREPAPENILEFFSNVSRGGMMSGSAERWYADSTFLDLRSTGNMRLIEDPKLRFAIDDYYGLINARFQALAGRHTGYVSFVHTAIPAELRENLSLEAIERFGVDFALERLMSAEFHALVNEEFNYMIYMSELDFEEQAESFAQLLEEHLRELEGP